MQRLRGCAPHAPLWCPPGRLRSRARDAEVGTNFMRQNPSVTLRAIAVLVGTAFVTQTRVTPALGLSCEKSGTNCERHSSMSDVPGTRGYAEKAADLIARYDEIPFERKHEVVLPLLPPPPVRCLDIGAGTGSDAAWLAKSGYDVVAVEPLGAFCTFGAQTHASSRIEWIDDHFPRLEKVRSRGHCFALVLATAVWMHLEYEERRTAMDVVSRLLCPGGLFCLTLRHGAVPSGRLMFHVSASETIRLAERNGLSLVANVLKDSLQIDNARAGVTWSHLAFRAP